MDDRVSPVYGTVGFQAPEIADDRTDRRVRPLHRRPHAGRAVHRLRRLPEHVPLTPCPARDDVEPLYAAATSRCTASSSGRPPLDPDQRFQTADEMAGPAARRAAGDRRRRAPASRRPGRARRSPPAGRGSHRRRRTGARSRRRSSTPTILTPALDPDDRRRPVPTRSPSSAPRGRRPTVELDLWLARALLEHGPRRRGRRRARRRRRRPSRGTGAPPWYRARRRARRRRGRRGGRRQLRRASTDAARRAGAEAGARRSPPSWRSSRRRGAAGTRSSPSPTRRSRRRRSAWPGAAPRSGTATAAAAAYGGCPTRRAPTPTPRSPRSSCCSPPTARRWPTSRRRPVCSTAHARYAERAGPADGRRARGGAGACSPEHGGGGRAVRRPAVRARRPACSSRRRTARLARGRRHDAERIALVDRANRVRPRTWR